MALNLDTFDPKSASDLGNAITGEIKTMGEKWWTTNCTDVEGYVRALSEAAMQTSQALAEGRLTEDQARQIFDMQKSAYGTTLNFTQYMTAALAQNVLDKTFDIVAHAVANKTGIDLFAHAKNTA